MSAAQPDVLIRFETLAPDVRIAHVTLDNVRRANSLNSSTMDLFVARLAELARDDTLHALVLTGAGERAFIGGADIGEMSGLDVEGARRFITRVHRCCEAVHHFPTPVIARINGVVLGAGLELAAACDLRVAVDTARFGMPEVHLGIPSVVEAALLPRLVGWGAAADLVLTGDAIDAARAHHLGFVQRLAPPDGLDAAVDAVLRSIAISGPAAVRQQKRLLRAWERLPLDDAIAAGITAFVESWEGDEPQRMMAATLAR